MRRAEYTKLFQQYYNERIQKNQAYMLKHNLIGKSFNSIEHPEPFLIDKEWEERRKKLDEPLLKKAKYKIGQKIEFWYIKTISHNKEKHTRSQGRITDLHTSDDGSGEIVYCFREITPPVEIINPYCLEQNVIKLI